MNELDIIYSDKYLEYDLGDDNPISRDKTQVFLRKIKSEGLIPYTLHEPEPATTDDLLLVHSAEYLRELKQLADNDLEFDSDTPVNRGMLNGGLFIVGGTILTLELTIQRKKVVNLIGGMHHAGSNVASGFCIYNDHAIAIRKLQSKELIEKAAVIDLDVHAGQGTQEIFYSDPSVMTVSIHQDPKTIYPGTGFEHQKGSGEAYGTNLNITLPPRTKEERYLDAVDHAINVTEKFNPDIFILVLGVDTYRGDQLGGLSLEKESFVRVGQRMHKFNNMAVLFGGGYSNEVPNLWLNFLKGYLGN